MPDGKFFVQTDEGFVTLDCEQTDNNSVKVIIDIEDGEVSKSDFDTIQKVVAECILRRLPASESYEPSFKLKVISEKQLIRKKDLY